MYSLPQPPPGPKPVVVRFARVSRLSVILPPHSVRFQQNLYNTWGLLLDINQADEGLLSRQRLQICADRIGAQGCPLPGLWGFIDGTVRPTARPRNNSFALHNSVLHPWLNQHSRDPKGKDILLFGDKGYGGTGFNLEMSRVRIAVEWAIGGIPTLSPRLNIKKDQCILSSNLVAQYRVCAFMRNALSW
ncbi:unnamed protein product [Tilletia caries]|nr:unnamed protein product [Tilletia caries]